eukprot:5614076-Pleurochrysis_carterae.AAC.1
MFMQSVPSYDLAQVDKIHASFACLRRFKHRGHSAWKKKEAAEKAARKAVQPIGAGKGPQRKDAARTLSVDGACDADADASDLASDDGGDGSDDIDDAAFHSAGDDASEEEESDDDDDNDENESDVVEVTGRSSTASKKRASAAAQSRPSAVQNTRRNGQLRQSAASVAPAARAPAKPSMSAEQPPAVGPATINTLDPDLQILHPLDPL